MFIFPTKSNTKTPVIFHPFAKISEILKIYRNRGSEIDSGPARVGFMKMKLRVRHKMSVS